MSKWWSTVELLLSERLRWVYTCSLSRCFVPPAGLFHFCFNERAFALIHCPFGKMCDWCQREKRHLFSPLYHVLLFQPTPLKGICFSSHLDPYIRTNLQVISFFFVACWNTIWAVPMCVVPAECTLITHKWINEDILALAFQTNPLHDSAAAFCASWGQIPVYFTCFFRRGVLCIGQAVSHIMDHSTSYSPAPKASPLRKVRGSGCRSQNRLGQLSISVGLAAEEEGRGWCESRAECFG